MVQSGDGPYKMMAIGLLWRIQHEEVWNIGKIEQNHMLPFRTPTLTPNPPTNNENKKDDGVMVMVVAGFVG